MNWRIIIVQRRTHPAAYFKTSLGKINDEASFSVTEWEMNEVDMWTCYHITSKFSVPLALIADICLALRRTEKSSISSGVRNILSGTPPN